MILKFVEHALCVHVRTNGCTRDHTMQTIEINCSRTLLDKLEWRTRFGVCCNVSSLLLIASFLKEERQQISRFLRQNTYRLSQKKNTRDKHITSANVITTGASRDKYSFKNVNLRMNIYFHSFWTHGNAYKASTTLCIQVQLTEFTHKCDSAQ